VPPARIELAHAV